jgi:TonB family protein
MTCLIKRVVPFALTLLVGLALGNLFSRSREYGYEARLGSFGERHNHCCHRSTQLEASYGLREHVQRFERVQGIPVVSQVPADSPATIDYQPVPARTEEAKRKGVTGFVELRVLLRKDGTVSDIEPVQGLAGGLTREAIKAAQEIRFTPARFNGEPVDATREITFYFGNDASDSD